MHQVSCCIGKSLVVAPGEWFKKILVLLQANVFMENVINIGSYNAVSHFLSRTLHISCMV